MSASFDFSLLNKIVKTPGAPGFEYPIRKFLVNHLSGFADEHFIDNVGNLVFVKRAVKGEQAEKRFMLAAHIDEIAFIVTHIDDKGFIRFHTLGGFDPKTLSAQRVIIHGKEDVIGVMGTKPIHVMSPEERAANPKIQDYFIDTGLSGEEVKKLVSVGDPITRERDLIMMGECVNGKSIDNRICVYILAQALKQIEAVPNLDIYFVFPVQEEMGTRGSVSATHNINPTYALNLDTTIAYDVPGAKPQEMVTELGKGCAIKIMDSSVISDIRMVKFLRNLADENGITWQNEILTGGNTDTGPMQRSGKTGAIAGAISIPTRHIHQVIEMAHLKDVENALQLTLLACKNITSNDWRF